MSSIFSENFWKFSENLRKFLWKTLLENFRKFSTDFPIFFSEFLGFLMNIYVILFTLLEKIRFFLIIFEFVFHTENFWKFLWKTLPENFLRFSHIFFRISRLFDEYLCSFIYTLSDNTIFSDNFLVRSSLKILKNFSEKLCPKIFTDFPIFFSKLHGFLISIYVILFTLSEKIRFFLIILEFVFLWKCMEFFFKNCPKIF